MKSHILYLTCKDMNKIGDLDHLPPEERRKILKQRIRNKTKPSNDNTMAFAKSVKSDPMTALMSMGIDDPDVLNSAKQITKKSACVPEELDK